MEEGLGSKPTRVFKPKNKGSLGLGEGVKGGKTPTVQQTVFSRRLDGL